MEGDEQDRIRRYARLYWNPRRLQRALHNGRRGGGSRRAARWKYFLYLHSTSQLADESNELGALDADGRFGAEEICYDNFLNGDVGTCDTRAEIATCRFGVCLRWTSGHYRELLSDEVVFSIS